MPGIGGTAGREPVAMTNVFAVSRRPLTSNASGAVNRPSPKITSTPRPRKRSGLSKGSIPAMTSRTRSMTRARIGLRIGRRQRPSLRIAHLEGDLRRLDQRLRRHAAVPQAVAAQLVLLDQRDLGAERAAAGGDHESAGAAADHDDIELG